VSLCPSFGYAQTSHHSALTIKVPFEFVVGNQTFPAGTYKFQSLLNSVPSQEMIIVFMAQLHPYGDLTLDGQVHQLAYQAIND